MERFESSQAGGTRADYHHIYKAWDNMRDNIWLHGCSADLFEAAGLLEVGQEAFGVVF